ncbi:MAG: CehA/McbA family metallohydrolase [Pirellulales bacterium]
MKKIEAIMRSTCRSVLALAHLCVVSAMAPGAEDAEQGRWRIIERVPTANADAEIDVTVSDAPAASAAAKPLPVRVVVTVADGTHPDGSGHGVYADGRFFADGHFSVRGPAGRTSIELQSGPNYVPLTVAVEAKGGQRLRVAASLRRWFSPESHGWYGGDNHVHAQHDATAEIKTGLDYTALQARAGGLSCLTEVGSNVSYADLKKLDTPTFLLRFAQELRPGPFVGHINTPGIGKPISAEVHARLVVGPLPAAALFEEARRLGGVAIHTHPLSPPHQLHWMEATELLSDAVLGRCADLVDIDSEATQRLWFAVLNLGNRVGASGSTDSALGRRWTSSPGDHRVYCRSDKFDYASMVQSLRQGRTLATNGGPVFAFFDIDGRGPGEVVKVDAPRTATATVEIECLYPLKTARLYRRGRMVKDFEVAGRTGKVVLTAPLALEGSDAEWYAFRAEDARDHWVVTSPVYVDSPRANSRRPASLALLEISNAERFIKLRREFFAHLVVTVSPEDALGRVELIKDGKAIQTFTPDMGDQLDGGRIPVTGAEGPYAAGWIWYPNRQRPAHLQADWPVRESGWYSIRAVTASGREIRSDTAQFRADNPKSHALSLANLQGAGTRWTMHGYGEEMPLAEIREPFEGDHWWYPANTYWRVATLLDGEAAELEGGANRKAGEFFRGAGR